MIKKSCKSLQLAEIGSKLLLMVGLFLLSNLIVEKVTVNAALDLDTLVAETVLAFRQYQFKINAVSVNSPVDIQVTADAEVIGERTNRLFFVLSNVYKPRIEMMRINGQTVTYRQQGDIYFIQLPFYLRKGQKVTLETTYRIEPKLKSQHVMIETGGNWYPRNIMPEKVRSRFKLMVPVGYMGVANGELANVQTSPDGIVNYHWEMNRPAASLGISIGKYQVISAKTEEMLYRIFFVPGNTLSFAEQILNEAQSISNYYQKVFGGEQPEEITVVLNDTQAEETAFGTLVFLHQTQNDLPALNFTLAHEIAHYWWGNLVIPQTIRDWWLVEGFANYAALMVTEQFAFEPATHLNKTALLDKWRDGYQRSLDNLNQSAVPEMSLAEIGPVDLQRELLYCKGAYVLHMTRIWIGDARFQAYLAEFVNKSSTASAGVRDFTRLGVELFGVQMVDFFRQWIYSAGYYDIALENVRVVRENDMYQLTFKLSNKGQLSLPNLVDLEITTSQGIQTEVLLFKNINVTIQKTLQERPLSIRVNSKLNTLETYIANNIWKTE